MNHGALLPRSLHVALFDIVKILKKQILTQRKQTYSDKLKDIVT